MFLRRTSPSPINVFLLVVAALALILACRAGDLAQSIRQSRGGVTAVAVNPTSPEPPARATTVALAETPTEAATLAWTEAPTEVPTETLEASPTEAPSETAVPADSSTPRPTRTPGPPTAIPPPTGTFTPAPPPRAHKLPQSILHYQDGLYPWREHTGHRPRLPKWGSIQWRYRACLNRLRRRENGS